MSSSIDQPIHMLSAVVDGVEFPKKGDLVGPAMAPVETNLTDNEGSNQADGEGKSRDALVQAGGQDGMQNPADEGYGEHKKQFWEETAEEVVDEIRGEVRSKDLLRVNGKEPFERDEYSD